MSREVQIGNIKLMPEHAQICASLTGDTLSALEKEFEILAKSPPDIIEWRFDLFADQDVDSLKTTLTYIKNRLGNTPLIFTIRTSREGSASEYTDDAYHTLCSAALDTGLPDAIDLEGTRPEPLLLELIDQSKKQHITTIYSYHNFSETPADYVLETIINRSEALCTDMVKLAVMPKTQADVLRFMTFSHRIAATNKMPIITIAMDTIGTITRIACDLTGSVMTFGVMKEASAPGQIPIADLRRMLSLVSGVI